MKKSYIKDGVVKTRSQIIVHKNGCQIINPKEADVLADGWSLLEDDKETTYKTLTEAYIRERYSVSDELALLRQRDVKKDEFDAYFAFCEECKARAKEIIGESATK